MIRRPRGIQLSWISEISLSLTWQRLDREDHAFALPSDAWTGDEPSGSVKLYNVPYYRALITCASCSDRSRAYKCNGLAYGR